MDILLHTFCCLHSCTAGMCLLLPHSFFHMLASLFAPPSPQGHGKRRRKKGLELRSFFSLFCIATALKKERASFYFCRALLMEREGRYGKYRRRKTLLFLHQKSNNSSLLLCPNQILQRAWKRIGKHTYYKHNITALTNAIVLQCSNSHNILNCYFT